MVALVGCHGAAAADAPTGADDEGAKYFETHVAPVFERRCYACHSHAAGSIKGGLTLDSRSGWAVGGDSGPAVVPGDPESSLLIDAVRRTGFEMPPGETLSKSEVDILVEWVRRGAPDPRVAVVTKPAPGIDYAAGRKFGSFQPLLAATLSPGTTLDAGRRIDVLWRAALRQRGLTPSPPADARTLIRRATFDLLGLPPTPEEVDAFVNDGSPTAYDRLLDRLLASPHYGERWGRHWLDLARYADGNKTSLEVRGQAWLYRDWVVRVLNEDLPYDEFVRRQLAADHIPDLPPAELAALGFLGGSPIYFKELKLAPELIKSIVADEWEERIDALGRTFLGLSIACARCHDHKFDPISVDDYYALAGVLASSRLTDRYIVDEQAANVARHAANEVRTRREQIKTLQSAKPAAVDAKQTIARLEAEIERFERDTPHFHSALAYGLDDAALFVLADGKTRTKLEYKPGEAIDLPIQIRGNPMNTGRVVPRRFLTVLSPAAPPPFVRGSGRRELAEALVTDAAPLTARVIVNRAWAHHFGRGLVETVSDFGTQGERPSHPELLDDLACRFVENGWSLKWLHREIMTSAAYRQSSAVNAANLAVDPENRQLWRMNRRRLDVEAWRDALLVSCGTLDRTVGGPPLPLDSETNVRRTLYGRIERSKLDDMLRLFDFPEPSTHAPNREPTTTALQQLFVLNGPLMLEQAGAFAARLQAESPPDSAAIVRQAYRRAFAREPSKNETQLGVAFLASPGDRSPATSQVAQYAQALLGSNEFLFVD